MTTCDQHGKLSNKLSWIYGVLWGCVALIGVGIGAIGYTTIYTINKVDEVVLTVSEVRVDMAGVKTELKIFNRNAGCKGSISSMVATNEDIRQRL